MVCLLLKYLIIFFTSIKIDVEHHVAHVHTQNDLAE